MGLPVKPVEPFCHMSLPFKEIPPCSPLYKRGEFIGITPKHLPFLKASGSERLRLGEETEGDFEGSFGYTFVIPDEIRYPVAIAFPWIPDIRRRRIPQ